MLHRRSHTVTAENRREQTDFPTPILLIYKTGQMSIRPSVRCRHFQNPKARYTLATKLNSTRSTLLKVDKSTVSLWPRTNWWQSRPYRQQSRPSWRQCRLRQNVRFKLLPICRQNWQQSRPYRQQTTLLPICCRRLCRPCVPGLRLRDSWHAYSMGLRTKVLESGILNFGPCVATPNL